MKDTIITELKAIGKQVFDAKYTFDDAIVFCLIVRDKFGEDLRIQEADIALDEYERLMSTVQLREVKTGEVFEMQAILGSKEQQNQFLKLAILTKYNALNLITYVPVILNDDEPVRVIGTLQLKEPE